MLALAMLGVAGCASHAAAPLQALGSFAGTSATPPAHAWIASSSSRWTNGERLRLRRRLDRVFAGGGVVGLGGYAVTALDGSVLYARRATRRFTPASTLKLLVAATALDALGPNYRFETRFVAMRSPDASGSLHGPIWFVGSGDPLLTSNQVRDGIAALRRAGLRRIDGPVLIDDSAFAGPEQNPRWDASDLDEGYAAATSAVSIDQDTVEFRITPTEPGRAARIAIDPPNLNVQITGTIVTGWYGGGTSLTIDREPESAPHNAFVCAGRIAPGSRQKYWRPIIGLSGYVGGAVEAMLERGGVAVTGGSRVGIAPLAAQSLWRHRSAPLSEILKEMLVHSNNHTAEQFLRAVGERSHRRGTDAAGLSAEREELARLGVKGAPFAIFDGSGLAPADKIEPLQLAELLSGELRGPRGGFLLRALPRVGVEGTVVYHELGAARGRARAKSGHLTGVNGLAGTVATRAHGRVAFAFLVNDPRSGAGAVTRAQDAALDVLAEF